MPYKKGYGLEKAKNLGLSSKKNTGAPKSVQFYKMGKMDKMIAMKKTKFEY